MRGKLRAGYAGVRDSVYHLHRQYDAVTAHAIGSSVLRRGIFSLELGDAGRHSLFVGGVRGGEWFSSWALLRFAAELCDARRRSEQVDGIDVAAVLKSRRIVIVPCLNPDGAEINLAGPRGALYLQKAVDSLCGHPSDWQANARGVDIALNFSPCKGTSWSPAPYGFAGRGALCEPESRALARLCEDTAFRNCFVLSGAGRDIIYRGERPALRAGLTARLLCGESHRMSKSFLPPGSFAQYFANSFEHPAFIIPMQGGWSPLCGGVAEQYRAIRTLLLTAMLA